MSEFEDAKRWLCIPPNYGFIWDKLQDIPLLQGYLPLKTNVAPRVDWWLQDGTRLLQFTTNILYYHVIALVSWLSPKAKKLWNVCKSDARWWKILQRGWHSHLPFHAKVFIWRVMIGGLPLGSALKRWRLGSSTCSFCTVPLEDSTCIGSLNVL